MKKFTLYILGIIIVIILAVVYSFSDFSVMNIIPRASLPHQYQDYKDIEKGVASTSYHSQLLFFAANGLFLDRFGPLFNTDNNTVIVDNQQDVKKEDGSTYPKQTYLKFDANGNTTDSLIYKGYNLSYTSGFLITVGGYCSWIVDGNKKIYPYDEQNAALTEDSLTVLKHFKQLCQDAHFMHCFDCYQLDDKRLDSLKVDKAIFLQHGKWIALYGKNLSYSDMAGHEYKDTSKISRMPNTADDLHIDKPNSFAYMAYFKKEHYSKGGGPTFGSETGSSTPNRWEGHAYLNLILKKDTLHVKQGMTMDDDWTPPSFTPYNTYYFTNKQINFALFTNDNYRFYIIRKKGAE